MQTSMSPVHSSLLSLFVRSVQNLVAFVNLISGFLVQCAVAADLTLPLNIFTPFTLGTLVVVVVLLLLLLCCCFVVVGVVCVSFFSSFLCVCVCNSVVQVIVLSCRTSRHSLTFAKTRLGQ